MLRVKIWILPSFLKNRDTPPKTTLDFTIMGDGQKSPSKKSIQQLKDKIKTVFQSMRGAPAWALIRKLNPILKGWANYHKHHVSKLTFQRIKQYLFHKIRAWLIRNHPHKSWYWRKRRYFRKLKGVQHFSDVAKDGKRIFLFQIDKMPIKRHRKIKMAANPYDPEWEMYFEQRLDEKMVEKLRKKLARLYCRQNGKCPHCGQPIDQTTGWNTHHIVEKHRGGTDRLDNLVMLHPNCHRQIHSRNQPQPSTNKKAVSFA